MATPESFVQVRFNSLLLSREDDGSNVKRSCPQLFHTIPLTLLIVHVVCLRKHQDHAVVAFLCRTIALSSWEVGRVLPGGKSVRHKGVAKANHWTCLIRNASSSEAPARRGTRTMRPTCLSSTNTSCRQRSQLVAATSNPQAEPGQRRLCSQLRPVATVRMLSDLRAEHSQKVTVADPHFSKMK